MKEKVFRILENELLDEFKPLRRFEERYDEIKNLSLDNIGIDSISFFEIYMLVVEEAQRNGYTEDISPNDIRTIYGIEKILIKIGEYRK